MASPLTDCSRNGGHWTPFSVGEALHLAGLGLSGREFAAFTIVASLRRCLDDGQVVAEMSTVRLARMLATDRRTIARIKRGLVARGAVTVERAAEGSGGATLWHFPWAEALAAGFAAPAARMPHPCGENDAGGCGSFDDNPAAISPHLLEEVDGIESQWTLSPIDTCSAGAAEGGTAGEGEHMLLGNGLHRIDGMVRGTCPRCHGLRAFHLDGDNVRCDNGHVLPVALSDELRTALSTARDGGVDA